MDHEFLLYFLGYQLSFLLHISFFLLSSVSFMVHFIIIKFIDRKFNHYLVIKKKFPYVGHSLSGFSKQTIIMKKKDKRKVVRKEGQGERDRWMLRLSRSLSRFETQDIEPDGQRVHQQ